MLQKKRYQYGWQDFYIPILLKYAVNKQNQTGWEGQGTVVIRANPVYITGLGLIRKVWDLTRHRRRLIADKQGILFNGSNPFAYVQTCLLFNGYLKIYATN